MYLAPLLEFCFLVFMLYPALKAGSDAANPLFCIRGRFARDALCPA